MMKPIFGAAFAIFASVTLAYGQAQTPAPAPDAPMAQPAKTTGTMLEAGANSFTEAQARSRLEKVGYASITGLMKDSEGIWRGKAMKDGLTMDVGLDFKGNIAAH